MECSKCQKEMKLVQAGVSKRTGKPYKAFYSCDRECGTTAPSDQVYAPPEKEPEVEVTWEPTEKDTGGTILLEELENMKTVIGRQTVAIDGLGERLDKMADWIQNNVK